MTTINNNTASSSENARGLRACGGSFNSWGRTIPEQLTAVRALRAYQRRTHAAEALIASAYRAGVNTRRVRRALTALFGGAVGKDTVSRTWRKVKGDWEAWNARSLADEPIVRLILDGTVVRVRLDRKATAISLPPKPFRSSWRCSPASNPRCASPLLSTMTPPSPSTLSLNLVVSREEFLLDALIDYQIEPEDPTRTIPNPERRALDKEIRAARADLARLERDYGAAADNAEQRRPTMRGFKIAHGKLGKQLRTARARVAQLFEQRRDVAKRVEVRDLNERAVVKLATERKHLTDIIKMVAYQAESDLLALLRPHYARADQEGRTLLHELFTTAGDIRVCDSELHITLAPLSSPHRTHAAQALCEMLDQTATLFPGSRLRMRFAVRSPPRIGLAFPGSPVERSATTAPLPRFP